MSRGGRIPCFLAWSGTTADWLAAYLVTAFRVSFPVSGAAAGVDREQRRRQ
ncbi:MAG: hypothetical protein HFH75_19500 [Lachnospiraceae bacterium]|nr:hypothetical protein [Lachnospiraceae bacterium]